jgi:hypothetical protein
MAVAHPWTRAQGLRAASFGFRATANVTIAGSRALLGTTLVRGGSATVGGAAGRIVGSVVAGYAIGAVVGTGISYALFGQSGMDDALDLYSGQVSFTKYVDTVGSGISSLF